MSRKLHGLLHQVSDLRPAFEAMAADWSTTMQRKFESEGAHEAGTDEAGTPNPPWEPLSARYAAWKARHYPGMPILQRTGALRQAAVHPQTDITADSLTLTVDVPYAIYHQARAREGAIPPPAVRQPDRAAEEPLDQGPARSHRDLVD
ncbi:MAG: phage virion morphogenesis protein [Armatimonadetes bacterium]|nr:phage virion morphogenesis protein [Armatimonadota bacterium]